MNYRARVAESAARHGVVGSVANLPDGTVAIDVQGALAAVTAFLDDIRGPLGRSDASSVERVAELPVDPEQQRFDIVR